MTPPEAPAPDAVPAFSAAAIVSSRRAALRPTATTEAPARAKAIAAERPMPLLPPVTTATMPLSGVPAAFSAEGAGPSGFVMLSPARPAGRSARR